MTKKKPTKKEIETVISGLVNHVKFLDEKINALDSIFGLYLNWRKDDDKFNKFVQERMETYNDEFNKDNEPGETK